MALDAYVMPLWRFKADDFSSPIEEALGVKPTVISLAEPPPRGPPWHLRLLAKIGVIEIDETELPPEERHRRARREVALLKRRVSKLARTSVDWPDEGGVHYNKQYQDSDALRTFAAWCDHRDQLPEFTPPPKHNFYEHVVWSLPKPGRHRFPTLVQHGLHAGYLLPVPFDGVHRVEPFTVMGHWKFFHDVASTQTILRELEDLLELIATLPGGQEEQHPPTPIGLARWGAQQLKQMCALSIEHSLPVIFHG